ncbi:MAG: hypothetical protein QNJ33_10765 [Crocosphaera sp.]|nr:hypothetical protein [Crocosphaera sp.]
MARELEIAKKRADLNGVDVPKCESLLQELISTFDIGISTKYEIIFYRALTGLYSAEDVAKEFNHSLKNINSDWNKNVGQYLRLYFELQDNERVGITTLRRVLFKQGYMKDLSKAPILSKRHQENPDLSSEGV